MNHGININRKVVKTKLLAFCFIIFVSFSLFSAGLVYSAPSSHYRIDSVIASSTNSNFSKVAYIESYWHNDGSSHFFLVVKDLNNNNSTTYNLCHYSRYCYEFYTLGFYNNSVVIFAMDFGSTYYYYFNLNTKKLGSFYGFNIFGDFLKFNSSIFSYNVSTVPNSVNHSQYQLHIDLRDILTQNDCSMVLDNYTTKGNPIVSISPDFSNLALAFGNEVNFYKIKDLKPILVQKLPLNITLDGSTNAIQFIQWQNSSILYYELIYNKETQFYSFNYKNKSTNLIHTFGPRYSINHLFIAGYYRIISFNPKYSLVVTSPNERIHYLNNATGQYSFDNSLGSAIMDSFGSQIIFWRDQEVVLMNFNQGTTTFKQIKVLSAVPSNELSLLSQIEVINFIITILMAIAIIPLSYAEKLWHF